MTPARNPKQWFCSPSGMLDGQLAWGAIWTKKCWFSIVNIDVWARNLVFRLDETRASVTKYWFFLIKMSGRAAGTHPPAPPSVSWKSVRTPQCKHCLGNKSKQQHMHTHTSMPVFDPLHSSPQLVSAVIQELVHLGHSTKKSMLQITITVITVWITMLVCWYKSLEMLPSTL